MSRVDLLALAGLGAGAAAVGAAGTLLHRTLVMAREIGRYTEDIAAGTEDVRRATDLAERFGDLQAAAARLRAAAARTTAASR